MIFFLVSASVPVDTRLPFGVLVARRAGACSPGHSRSAAVLTAGVTAGEAGATGQD
jgi:hypothetical protein